MVCYKITYKRAAEKGIRAIKHDKLCQQIVNRIKELSTEPHAARGGKKILGAPNLYRIRHGNYRIIFTVDKQQRTVDIIKVAKRDKAYKNILRD